MAPYYASYKEWAACGDKTIAWAVQLAGKSGDEAGQLAAISCNDQLDQLRASLAREVGLEEAGRFYRRANYLLRETGKDYWKWAHEVPSQDASRSQAGR
ncbi:hypothetical protein [Sphingomonas sp. 1P08PE]|uniref:hypothetical protein n=1 Tax=Sphingomonas sp. 1P08PE TaxID=554122 RepID=UPI0039A153B0